MDFLLKALTKFTANVTIQFINIITSSQLSQFKNAVFNFAQNKLVVASHNTMLVVSISLIVFFSVKQIFDVYVLEMSGDPEASPVNVLERATYATAITSCSTWIFYSFLNFTALLATKLVEKDQEVDLSEVTRTLESSLTAMTSGSFLSNLFFFSLVIGMLVFSVIAVIRAVELAMMYIVLPIFCIELCFTNRERLKGLITNIVVTGVYYSIQLLLFKVYLITLGLTMTGLTTNPDSPLGLNAFTTLGLLVAVLKSPKWLEKFAYNSGVGDSVKRGASATIQGIGRVVLGGGK